MEKVDDMSRLPGEHDHSSAVPVLLTKVVSFVAVLMLLVCPHIRSEKMKEQPKSYENHIMQIDSLFEKQDLFMESYFTDNEVRPLLIKLEDIMLDKSRSDEDHVKYAKLVIKYYDVLYEFYGDTIKFLSIRLDKNIEALKVIIWKVKNQQVREKLSKYHENSQKLYENRIIIMDYIIYTKESNSRIPKMIIKDKGNIDIGVERNIFEDLLKLGKKAITAIEMDKKLREDQNSSSQTIMKYIK